MYAEIFEECLLMELTICLPGCSGLCIFGGSRNCGLSGYMLFKPSAMFVGIFCLILNASIIPFMVLACL